MELPQVRKGLILTSGGPSVEPRPLLRLQHVDGADSVDGGDEDEFIELTRPGLDDDSGIVEGDGGPPAKRARSSEASLDKDPHNARCCGLAEYRTGQAAGSSNLLTT